MAETYTVKAALVVALVGGKVQHFYHGDVVPVNIDEASLANLLDLGFVATSSDEKPKASATPAPVKRS